MLSRKPKDLRRSLSDVLFGLRLRARLFRMESSNETDLFKDAPSCISSFTFRNPLFCLGDRLLRNTGVPDSESELQRSTSSPFFFYFRCSCCRHCRCSRPGVTLNLPSQLLQLSEKKAVRCGVLLQQRYHRLERLRLHVSNGGLLKALKRHPGGN